MLLRILRRYLKPHWKLLVAVGLFQAAQSIASLYLPNLIADIIDNGIAKGDVGHIMVVGGIMLAITLAQIACAITAVYYGAKASMSLGRDLRGAIFHRVSEFSEREVSQFGAPSLITRTTNDVQQVQMVVLMTCTLFVAAPILAVGGIIMAMQQDIGLSWLMAVSVPVLLISIGLVISRMVPLFRLMQKRIDVVNQVLREQLTGIRVIRAFVRENIETTRFGKANAELTETSLGAGRLFALMFPIVMFVLNVSSVAVIWFGGLRVESGEMQVGALVAYLSYLLQILMAVMMATFMGVMLPRAAVSADRIGEVLETETSVRMPEHGVTALESSGTVEFVDVSFSYPKAEQPVLRNVSFAVRPGQTTAIIGSTGAGKTTLMNLLPRLFDATGGSVFVDGVNVRELDPDTALEPHRAGAAEAVPVRRHRRQQPALRQAGCHRRRAVGGAADRAGQGLRRGDGRRPGRRHLPGRHERLRRAAAAAGHRQGAGQAAGDLHLRRLVLGAGQRHRRPAPAGTEEIPQRGDDDHRRPAGVHHHGRRPDHRARGRRDRRQRNARATADDFRNLR